MNAWLADTDAEKNENPWIVYHATRVRRERRRVLNQRYRSTGNGAWKPFVPVTPGMVARAATHLQTVLYSDARMKETAHVL